jgi:DNA polymerase-3 subunit alpha/error-prone DNA polymerase
MKISSFVPIHNRSSYSLLRGCLNPEDIVEQASLAGFSAVGMVDINNFYGMVRFRSSARNFCIKPLSGVAIVPPSGPRFTALCLTRQGFGRANELVTAVLREGPWDPVNDLLEKGWKGLYILSEDRDFLSRLRERGSSNLYTALFHGKPFHQLALWGRKAGIPPMALNDAVCKTRRDQQLFKILRAIDLNTTVDALDPGELLRPEHEMVEADAMERFFSAIPEALENGMNRQNSFFFPSITYSPPSGGSPNLKHSDSFGRYASRGYAGVTDRFAGIFRSVLNTNFPSSGGRGSPVISSWFIISFAGSPGPVGGALRHQVLFPIFSGSLM